jgi:stalled ribosome alternative rescue factor ArfA
MEDNRTNLDEESLMVPMTEQHIDDALLAVTNQIVPYCALETQKQGMGKYARKPYKMGAKQFVTSMSRINNYIPFFPNATVLSKYSEEELLNILEFAARHWRKAFDLRDYLPTSDDKARFISECERIERNETPPARERDGSDDDRTSNKKSKFAKSEKSGQKTNTESGPMYCTHCRRKQSAAGS